MPTMPDLYPNEALDYSVMRITDIIRIKLDETLLANDACPIHGLYALALALAWRLQSYPMAERTILHGGLADLIRLNALELREGDQAR